MCTIKFLIRQPWLYMAAGLLILALMLYAIFDVKNSKAIAYDELDTLSGEVITAKALGQQATGERYVLTIKLENGQEAQWQVSTSGAISAGDAIVARIHNKSLYELVAHDAVLVAYADTVAQEQAKAQQAKNTLTHPVTILLALFLIAAGIVIEVFKRRNTALYQKYCVCAADRIAMMEQEG